MKLFFSLVFFSSCAGFSFPGLAPVTFCEDRGENCPNVIPLFVNRLDSVESLLSYEYDSFDFCKNEIDTRPSESFGRVLLGERIDSSPIKFSFKKDVRCQPVCTKRYRRGSVEDANRLDFLKMGMELNYQQHWTIDNMLVTWCYNVEWGQKYCNPGFPIGCLVTQDGIVKDACVINPEFNRRNTFYVFNHVDIRVTYTSHSEEDDGWSGGRLVAATLEPRSIRHKDESSVDCEEYDPMAIPVDFDDNVTVVYTYSVVFEENNAMKWASRWDYLPHTYFQWTSVIPSLVIVLVLSGLFAVIMLRTLHKDIARYSQDDQADLIKVLPSKEKSFNCEAQGGSGWRKVHRDVFRPPGRALLLSVFIGQGTQITMTFITLLFACLSFASPAHRGDLMTCAVVSWVLFSAAAGYVSAALYKTFGGNNRKLNVLLTALLCPGIFFSVFLLMNVILWVERSSAAIPVGTLYAVLGMWLGISVPLTFIGAHFGFMKPMIKQPVQTYPIPRQIPHQSFFTKPLVGIVLGGILPYACIFTQLCLIFRSIWSWQMYFTPGFLFLVFVLLLISCSEVTVLLCYCHLCAEDHHWWWRSFLTSGFAAVYVFIFAVHYFFSKLVLVGAASTFLYFGYTVMMVLIFFLFTGTVGFFACFWFVNRIYREVEEDGVEEPFSISGRLIDEDTAGTKTENCFITKK